MRVIKRGLLATLSAGLFLGAPPSVLSGWALEASEYTQAAEEGDADAQNSLGYCYEYGLGVARDPLQAVRWYRKAADAGHAEAQNNLGVCYDQGMGVTKDAREAVRWFRKAADAGSATAQRNMGLCYQNGDGVPKAPKEAFRWYLKAAEAENKDAQYALGDCYLEGTGVEKDPSLAIKWYRRAADAGNLDAQVSLGHCYGNGIGVEKDAAEAVIWYRKAAESNSPSAQRILGICYRDGDGVAKNPIEAFKWFHKAAEAGDSVAQSCLGECYEEGFGVKEDPSQAALWYRKAADAGDEHAQCNLARCYEDGNGVEQSYEQALGWYRRAAEVGNGYAQHRLGWLFYSGNGVAADPAQAFRWFIKAAEAGDASAQDTVGWCYYYGEGVAQHMVEAVRWFRKAAEGGDAHGQANMGERYEKGEGVAKDLNEALRWYRKSAEGDSQWGQNKLGECYRDGIGVERDAGEALRWFKKAAERGSVEAMCNIASCYATGVGVPRSTTEAASWYAKAAEAQQQEDREEGEPTPATHPAPKLVCSTSFHEPSGNNALDADEVGELRLRLTNQGKGFAHELKIAITGATPNLAVPRLLTVDDLAPGESKDLRIPVSTTRALPAGQVDFSFGVSDTHGFDAPLIRQRLETRAFLAPRFAVQLGVEDGNGNGLVERGEELMLKVVLQNKGGAARGVRLALKGPDGITWLGSREPVTLGDISGGSWKEARFACLVRNQYAGSAALSLKAEVTEARPDLNGSFPVVLTLNQAGPQVEQRIARATAEERAEGPAPEVSDPVDSAPAKGHKQTAAYAVIIGIERYKQPLVPTVDFARRDATIVREYVVKTLGVPSENVRLLVDNEATLAEIRTALSAQLANSVEGSHAKVYVYFAGHGAPDLKSKRPFLVPYDGNPAYPETSCFALAELYESLGRLPASVTVMLDACFSGASGRGDTPNTLLAQARPALVELKATSTPTNVTVLSAANGDQVSSGFMDKKHGLFTYFLLKGLGGEADANGDMRLTLDELHHYVTPLVQRQARKLNREQTPTLQGKADATMY
jgi:hypothetical protein